MAFLSFDTKLKFYIFIVTHSHMTLLSKQSMIYTFRASQVTLFQDMNF